jgi:hypothetical protein
VRFLTIILTIIIAGCSATSYNPTTYPFAVDKNGNEKNIKRIVIATHNLGKPSRSYLQKQQAKIDRYVVDYLETNGYTIVNSKLYDDAYQKNVRSLGNPYDYSTGRIDQQLQMQVIGTTIAALNETGEIDGILYTDLIERHVTFTVGQKRVARWDGVNRGPKVQGASNSISSDFNWSKLVDAASIATYLYSLDGQLVFHSIGGLSLTEAVDTKGTASFKRARNIFNSQSQIEEGIQLAFHPLIVMKDWPGDAGK